VTEALSSGVFFLHIANKQALLEDDSSTHSDLVMMLLLLLMA
jgi:hypothetical protein